MKTEENNASPPASAPVVGSVWVATATELPPLDEIVWLWDGNRIWVGSRTDDCEGWLWGNAYGTMWHNGVKWDADVETDDDYKPTHWMRLPSPPNSPTEPRHED